MEPWQTRASEFHPYMVDSVDALPARLREKARAALQTGDSGVRAFVVPADYRSTGDEPPHVVPEQALLFTRRGVVHVMADAAGLETPLPVEIDAGTLLWLRSSHLLLYGRLELAGPAAGQLVNLAIEFNAVGWRLMQPEWHALVGRAIGLAPATPTETYELSAEAQQLVAAVPDKFVDGLSRYGLYTGETLVDVVFQPTVWKQNLITFDEQLLPNTLLALTDASVLIIEEESALVRKSEQFGLIITRMPRRAIAAVEASPPETLQEIRFALTRDGVTAEKRVQLTPDVASVWLALWNRQATGQ